ncbi:Isotrichodermin C-15 hydroxylase [Tolypocladium ophioglossoides CBS 100239]|uniref:Isotrichodermin C-15 hydroxylase n=1 Tax=Tolypocladium ophioglossoides (strain CBS 100239) TaxID=1163406 RepID=A0A0L0MX45_TOLOC|nr:Isotrichodermin C-15 hydroxylase [Tolypocladium ophioglossoides CBS 100239]
MAYMLEMIMLIMLYYILPVFTLFFLHLVGLAFYRLYLHPLSRFPGPRLNAVSALPCAYSLAKGRHPFNNRLLHEIYGPVVRISPNELIFNSAQAWEDIYGFKAGGQANLPRDPIHLGSADPLNGCYPITLANGADHARQRRALAHAFSDRALREHEGIVQGYVDKLVNHLRQREGEEINLVAWFSMTSFDIIGDLAFGESFGCLSKDNLASWYKLNLETFRIAAFEQATRRLAEANSWMQRLLMALVPSSMRQLRRDHMAYSREKVVRRLKKENSERPDFIHYILKQKERFTLDENEIIVNGATFIAAGSETTSNLLSGLVAQLLFNPDKYEKLCHDIRSNFTHPEEINHERASRLPYLNACLDEALRLKPPVGEGLLRRVPKGGAKIDGHLIPEGTSVAVDPWSASHNQTNFRDCDDFVPERWLEDKENCYAGDQRKATQPFSVGPQGCIGKNLAYMEMRLILSHLIWHFDISSTDGAWQWDPTDQMKNLRVFIVWEKPALNVMLKVVTR